jgi:hypothetical protein
MKKCFDQYLWIKGHSHYNSGHPHQNNILTIDMLLKSGLPHQNNILTVDMLLKSGLPHQNIESKNEILTMQAKL